MSNPRSGFGLIELMISMVLGLLHLNTGMVVSAVQKCKRGDKAGAIWEEGSLWVILLGGVLLALDMFFVHSSVLHYAALAVLVTLTRPGRAVPVSGAGRTGRRACPRR